MYIKIYFDTNLDRDILVICEFDGTVKENCNMEELVLKNNTFQTREISVYSGMEKRIKYMIIESQRPQLSFSP